MKVLVLTGPESTGKSWLAQRLLRTFGGVMVGEYVRHYIEQTQRDTTLADIPAIARGQLDWEDAAIGDPLSDLACSRLELRYKFGLEGMQAFTETYGSRLPIDWERLALWDVYVASAVQHFMGDWGLLSDREAHMRQITLTSIREAGAALMSGADFY